MPDIHLVDFGELMSRPDVQVLVMAAYAWGREMGDVEFGDEDSRDPLERLQAKLAIIGSEAMSRALEDNMRGQVSPARIDILIQMIEGLHGPCAQSQLQRIAARKARDN